MNINKEKLLEYLDRHVGDNMKMLELINESGTCEGMSEEEIREDLLRINHEIHEIAEDNGYRLNSDHHKNDECGMPWVYDFYIEIADVDKDIARIDSAFQLKMKTWLVQKEYGIWDDDKDMFVGFRPSIPWQIKKIYDEVNDEIEELEKDGRIID